MGLERGAVRVSGRVWCGLFPFFDEEAPTLELQLGVGAARRRGWVVFAKKVLGGHREGFEPARAQDKEHGVREGIQGEVGPVPRGRPWLEPREG